MEDLLTIEETALYLRVSESTVRRMVKDGRIPARQIGRQWRIPRAALEEYLGGDNPLELLATLARMEGDSGNEQALAVFLLLVS